MYRCITGDHYIVVFGNHLKEICMLMKMLDVQVLTPTKDMPRS